MDAHPLIPLLVQLSLVLIVAGAGLQARWRDLMCALERPGLFLRAFVAVNVVVPLAAVIMALLLPVDRPVKLGIVIMAVSPMAPFVPGKLFKAGAGASVAVGLYFALILLAIVVVPATVALLSALFPGDAELPVGEIAWFVAKSVLLPLAGGLVLAELLPGVAPKIGRIADLAGKLLLLPLLIGIVYASGGSLIALVGKGALLAIVVAIVAGLAAGHLLGGPDGSTRMALALAAATRHPGIAAMVAHRNFDDPRVVPAIVLFLLVSILVSALYQAWAKRRLASPAPAAEAAPHPTGS